MAVEVAEAVDIVLEFALKAEDMFRPADVAKATGLDSKVVSKAIATLKKEGKVDSPKRCYYAAVR
jgi:DNA-binding IscR family transcriptional regulator